MPLLAQPCLYSRNVMQIVLDWHTVFLLFDQSPLPAWTLQPSARYKTVLYNYIVNWYSHNTLYHEFIDTIFAQSIPYKLLLNILIRRKQWGIKTWIWSSVIPVPKAMYLLITLPHLTLLKSIEWITKSWIKHFKDQLSSSCLL